MDRPHREAAGRQAAVRRMLAWLGAATAVVGVIGLLLAPSAYLVWVFMIAFGVATVPRWLTTQSRKRRHPQKPQRPA
jgi:Flp pilus assembly protein TadB